jgi:hypothetical protein
MTEAPINPEYLKNVKKQNWYKAIEKKYQHLYDEILDRPEQPSYGCDITSDDWTSLAISQMSKN